MICATWQNFACEPIVEEIMQKLKGADFVIPRQIDRDHILKRLKPDTLKRFLDCFNAGERIYVPVKKQRDLKAETLRLSKQGMSPEKIALDLGCTKRWVTELLRSQPKMVDGSQPDLFAIDTA